MAYLFMNCVPIGKTLDSVCFSTLILTSSWMGLSEGVSLFNFESNLDTRALTFILVSCSLTSGTVDSFNEFCLDFERDPFLGDLLVPLLRFIFLLLRLL